MIRTCDGDCGHFNFWNVIRRRRRYGCCVDDFRAFEYLWWFDRLNRWYDLWCMQRILTRWHREEARVFHAIAAIFDCTSEALLKWIDVLQIVKDPQLLTIVQQSRWGWRLVS